MSANTTMIAKVGGAPGRFIMRLMAQWAASRKDRAESSDSIWTTGRYPKATIVQAATFVAELRAHRCEPEVLFFAEWADQWGGAGPRFFFELASGNPAVVIDTGYDLLVCYALPDKNLLAKSLHTALRRSHLRLRSQQEDRWFVVNLLEAVHAWEKLVAEAVLVVALEPTGPSVRDNDVLAACRVTSPWLKGINRRSRSADVLKNRTSCHRGWLSPGDA